MAKLIIDSNYGIAPNEFLHRKDISFKAKGIFTYIQSKPADWDFAIERMEATDGKDGIRSGIRELEDKGYLKRELVSLGYKKFETVYTLFAEPQNSMAEKSTSENTPSNNTTTKNPPPIKERSTKQEIQNNSSIASFAIFWDKYPNKKSKPGAERAFSKLSEKDQWIAINILNNHLAYWRKKYGTPGKEKYPGTYVPHPATWLNGRRWEDTLEEVIPETRSGSSDFALAKRKEEEAQKRDDAKKILEREEIKRKEAEMADDRMRARRFFNDLDPRIQEEIRDKATAQLVHMEGSKEKYPEQYRIIYDGKITSVMAKEYGFVA